MKTVDFSETIAASDLKVSGSSYLVSRSSYLVSRSSSYLYEGM